MIPDECSVVDGQQTVKIYLGKFLDDGVFEGDITLELGLFDGEISGVGNATTRQGNNERSLEDVFLERCIRAGDFHALRLAGSDEPRVCGQPSHGVVVGDELGLTTTGNENFVGPEEGVRAGGGS